MSEGGGGENEGIITYEFFCFIMLVGATTQTTTTVMAHPIVPSKSWKRIDQNFILLSQI